MDLGKEMDFWVNKYLKMERLGWEGIKNGGKQLHVSDVRSLCSHHLCWRLMASMKNDAMRF